MAFFSGLLRKGLKPQSFNYIPRHYNPQVDDLHQRLKMGKYAETDDVLNNKELIKERLRRGMKRNALQNIKKQAQICLFSQLEIDGRFIDSNHRHLLCFDYLSTKDRVVDWRNLIVGFVLY